MLMSIVTATMLAVGAFANAVTRNDQQQVVKAWSEQQLGEANDTSVSQPEDRVPIVIQPEPVDKFDEYLLKGRMLKSVSADDNNVEGNGSNNDCDCCTGCCPKGCCPNDDEETQASTPAPTPAPISEEDQLISEALQRNQTFDTADLDGDGFLSALELQAY